MKRHVSVLTQEVQDGIARSPDATIVDCTFGSGGHAAALIRTLDHRGTYLGIDVDQSALDAAQDLTKSPATVRFVCDNFRNIAAILAREALTPTAILADLGWRSEQFEEGSKGFSFKHDEPLVMTFGDPEHYPFTAHDIANVWEEESIADIVFGYGEERFARRIARNIVAAREEGEIKTSGQLAEIVTRAVPAPFRHGRIHPATKTFQAFRIAVNDELGALKQLLTDGFEALEDGGRLAIISFHSLEDRIVKQYFSVLAHDQRAQVITKKPITASDEEQSANPRARSAKLRILEKIEHYDESTSTRN